MEEDKKLWKIKYGTYKDSIGVCFGTFVVEDSDIIKATESEALEWLSQFERKYLTYGTDLYYKEDGEWILYRGRNK